jgi:hypothetical protein
VAANFRNRNFHATNEKSRHGVKGHPFFILVGAGEGRDFFQVVFGGGEWTVHCSLSTWTVDSRLSIQSKSSQVPDMFPQRVPNSTLLSSHVLWQNVVLLSAIIGGPKGKNLCPN